MPKLETFSYLIISLHEFCQKEQKPGKQKSKYPYPDMFRIACNELALKMPYGTYPRTQTGLLKLFEQPVENWWPDGLKIPEDFDRSSGLLYDGKPSEETFDYLYTLFEGEFDVDKIPNSVNIQIIVENKQFRDLFLRLNEEYISGDSDRAQEEYIKLRSFLIDRPYTTATELRKEFTGTRCISNKEVGDLYEDCDRGRTYWNCDRCGPLFEKHGRLQGIKPEACRDHRQELDYVREIPWEQDLRYLKPGIHSRVCLPGIPEMNLWRSLQKLQEKYPKQLVSTHLWPGLDSYDMQLRFSDNSVWAVDVKDYRNPHRLGKKLTTIQGITEDLRYTEAFYVFPSRRLKWRENYIQIVRDRATNLSQETHLLSIPSFQERIEEKIQSLTKEKRK
ncbi:hypothetical protein PJF56_00055 [Roseofilum sp. BLCC_M91]|uniref:REase associating with pPIWI RE domain-containing protein n=1 Tax=Roseofilum halophilum BLCC-M91 TaxID=3022259 RepID=A0ABT7BDK4_9CYAN|nr:hypothetical protein [Roseofilum halophilum]MDJ1177249.1 hypothetical protein [Roseofilum halophilum BLCC-M91]